MPRKKVITGPTGKDLKAFQSRFGDQWRQFVNSPAFQAGMQYLRNKKLEEVALLSPDDVLKYGAQLQSELRGFLQLENRMFNLPEVQDFSLPISDEQIVYLSPEQEAEEAQLREKFAKENRKQHYA